MSRRIPINALVWSLTDHVCRRSVEDGGFCGGRIVSKALEDGKPFSRCTRCGTESAGGHRTLCVCGETIRNGKKMGSNAGIRCVKNDERTQEFPDEIVVRFAPDVRRDPAQKKPIDPDDDDLFGES